MYSPKIRSDLVPRIYHVAKDADVPMTVWVNEVVERALSDSARPGDERRAGVDNAREGGD